MAIKDIFVKDIYRNMNPVIKVSDQDDESTIFQELDEYVVTRDIEKNFDKLYKGITDGMKGNKDHIGVWISGDFGSGKSHFLKIVSFLLKNGTVCGKDSIEYLRDKVSVDIYSMMRSIGKRNIDTILFDIDAKSKRGQDEDSLVQTFTMVFNEMLGLSSVSSVANLERHLMSVGLYDRFIEEFQANSKRNASWEDSRKKPAFVKGDIIKALLACGAYSDEREAEEVAKAASIDPGISAEEFAEMVGDHCRSKGKDYTLFFLVDEVGQFISGNVQKMLKLQTIVQELGVKAQGQAWVIVTSQEDIEAIVSGVSSNDFSKIQGRFSTRIKMVSSDVKEVIEKRILEKRESDGNALASFYDANSSSIRNSLALDNKMNIRLYRDSREFVATYPFIPYQFDMLQVMLTQLRNRSAAGKNLSNAARSMLRLFKDATVNHGDCNLDIVIPIYGFFEPIRDELDAPTNLVFSRARDNVELNDFDIDVLKTLYLVKYYDGLDTNIGNISALMMSSLNQNRIELRSMISESLERLVEQNFVLRSGDIYIYLTNQEQEVNREIRNTNVDQSTLCSKMADVAFGNILNCPTKYSYDNNHNYAINRFVDEENINNTDHELSIRVSTHKDPTHPTLIPSKSENGVIFKLPDDKRVIDLFVEYIRTEEYIRKNDGSTLTPQHREVINSKRSELQHMKDRARAALETALQDARIYVNGSEVDIPDTLSPQDRFRKGMDLLIGSVYNKMGYIKGGSKSKKDVESIFKTATLVPFDDLTRECGNAMADLASYLNQNAANNTTILVKNVMERFSRKPYGFADSDIQWLLSVMFRHGRVDIVYEGREYRGRDINSKLAIDLMTIRSNHDKVRVIVREAVTQEQVLRAKNVYDKLFAKSLIAEESQIVDGVNESAGSIIGSIDAVMGNYEKEPRYPGKNRLNDIRSTMVKLSKMQSPDLFKFTDQNEDMLRSIRDEYDNLIGFFSPDNTRRRLYNMGFSAVDSYNANREYLPQESRKSVDEINAIIGSGDPKLIPKLNVLCPQLQKQVDGALADYKVHAVSEINEEFSAIRDKYLDDPDVYSRIGEEIEGKLAILSEAKSIDAVNNTVRGLRYSVETIERSVSKPNPSPTVEPAVPGEPSNPAQSTPDGIENSGGSPTTVLPVEPPVPVPRKVVMKSISGTKKTIDDEDGIEEFLDGLRSRMREKLRDGPFEMVW